MFYYPVLKRLLYPFYYFFDVFVYVLKLIADQRIKIIQVSPSLIPVPLIRDGVLILLAKLFGKKVVIFYRGWKLPTYNVIQSKSYIKSLFNWIFQKDTLQVVLASSFKRNLHELHFGKTSNILVTTTAIDKTKIFKSTNNTNSKTINWGKR